VVEKKKRVVIVGFGLVGKAEKHLLDMVHSTVIHDPVQHFHAFSPGARTLDPYDLAVVCVPTPVGDEGHDLRFVREALTTIGPQIPTIIRSTMTPGSTRRLSEEFERDLAYAPEFVGASTYFTPSWRAPDPHDASTHPMLILGATSENLISHTLGIYQPILGPYCRYHVVENPETAELVKCLDNCWGATKVAFCHLFSDLGDLCNASSYQAREAWLSIGRVDPAHTLVFTDRAGFKGSHCLGKDLEATRRFMRAYVPTALLDGVLRSEEERLNPGEMA
jgi:UDP-glucose 6-dehydrogenase